ncbi:conserved hypothetical protein [Candidatus Accumulibacter aalborgensis]|uniref:Uncharacterized protein n=1 Tax=Candidatus Accumulibacter aalborgensis TaxID=1860102 RepID=A0A1A8XJ29_9PROT|nr:hypothetical protein [Candidatus Accumulibacter aalborgensis]SBT04387.1 conserved hypothetical protein [Candidatus Accumulibacter aalborgensis]
MNDSIIKEVRNIRDQHAASMGYDLDRIYADLQARQEKHAAEGWVVVPPPSNPPPEPELALQRTRFARR